MRAGILVAVAATWVAVCGAGGAAAQTLDPETASALVGGLAHDAVSRLSVKGLSHADRVKAVRDLIARYSDQETLSQQILGRSWESMSAEEKAQFEDRLTEYLVAICAGMLKGLSPDTSVVVKGEDVVKAPDPGAERVVVHTMVRSGPAQPPVLVDWWVGGGHGRVFLADVSAEGVGLIRTMSSDFRAVLFANGGRIGALVAAMNQKITLADTSD